MRKIAVLMLLALLVSGLAWGQTPLDSLSIPVTQITWEAPFFDFKKARDGDKVEHVFQFTNTGTAPLVISNARGSCGCTIPEWPNEAILPGQKGAVKVVFDTSNKRGQQLKVITVTANTTPVESRLQIGGEVLPPKKKRKNKGG